MIQFPQFVTNLLRRPLNRIIIPSELLASTVYSCMGILRAQHAVDRDPFASCLVVMPSMLDLGFSQSRFGHRGFTGPSLLAFNALGLRQLGSMLCFPKTFRCEVSYPVYRTLYKSWLSGLESKRFESAESHKKIISNACAVITSRGQCPRNLSISRSALRTVRESFPSYGSPPTRRDIFFLSVITNRLHLCFT